MSLPLPITVEQIEEIYPKAMQVVRTFKEGAEFCGIFATKKEAIKYVVERVIADFRQGHRHQVARKVIEDLLSYGQTGDRSDSWYVSKVEGNDRVDYEAFDAVYSEIHGARVDAKVAELVKREAEAAERAAKKAERSQRGATRLAELAAKRKVAEVASESSEGSEGEESSE